MAQKMFVHRRGLYRGHTKKKQTAETFAYSLKFNQKMMEREGQTRSNKKNKKYKNIMRENYDFWLHYCSNGLMLRMPQNFACSGCLNTGVL